jgi:hypothetical protein
MTWDNGTFKAYLNGVQIATNTYSDLTGIQGNPYIGSLDASSGFFPGQIDDVKIFNYALTPVQIKTLYNNGAVSFGP